jgi:trk system potassium uptake protein
MTIPRTIALGFLAIITAGALLLMLPFSSSSGHWINWITALFTSTSAVCVTGHIVVDTATFFSPFGQVVIMILIQLGGLGYMTATTFLLLLLGRKFGLKDKIALQQALDRQGLHGTKQLLQSIIATTLIFELAGIFILYFSFLPKHGPAYSLWFALFHSVSAWNNAGFSLFSDNLMGYQASLPINLAITGLIVFGGIGYEVIFELYLRLRERFSKSPVRTVRTLNFKVAVSTTLVLLGIGTIGTLLIEFQNPGTLGPLAFPGKLLASWFQSVTSRTAGFNTIDIGKMTNAGLFITIALMFVGGSPGGTAGGIKTTTLRVLTSCTNAVLQGKEDVLLYERSVAFSLVLKAVGVTIGSLATVLVATIAICISDSEVEFIRVLFEVVSAFGTVGLSTGITAALTPVAKLILIATMYIGRVGILLLITVFLGDPKRTSVNYPEGSLLVG